MLLKIRIINLQTFHLPSPPSHPQIKQAPQLLLLVFRRAWDIPYLSLTEKGQICWCLVRAAISWQLQGGDITDKIPLGHHQIFITWEKCWSISQYLREFIKNSQLRSLFIFQFSRLDVAWFHNIEQREGGEEEVVSTSNVQCINITFQGKRDGKLSNRRLSPQVRLHQ